MPFTPVYSTLMIATHAGASGAYTVPAGFRAVLRFVTAFNASGILPESAQLIIVGRAITIWYTDLLAGQNVNAELRVVLNEGDDVTNVVGADVDFTLSGYQLTLP